MVVLVLFFIYLTLKERNFIKTNLEKVHIVEKKSTHAKNLQLKTIQ